MCVYSSKGLEMGKEIHQRLLWPILKIGLKIEQISSNCKIVLSLTRNFFSSGFFFLS